MQRWTIRPSGKRLDPAGRWVTYEDHRAELERLLGFLEDHDPNLAEIVRGEMGEIPEVPEERPAIMHAIGGPDLEAIQRAHEAYGIVRKS